MRRMLICLAIMAAGLYFFPPACHHKKMWAKSYLNRPAPEFAVERWLSAAPPIKGQFLLIDFWATWCPPCRATIPELNKIHRQFRNRVTVIGVSDETEDAVRAMQSPQIDYYVAIDSQRRMKNALEVTGIPHVILVDPEGIVRWEGFPLLNGEELTPEVVEKIVAKYSAK